MGGSDQAVRDHDISSIIAKTPGRREPLESVDEIDVAGGRCRSDSGVRTGCGRRHQAIQGNYEDKFRQLEVDLPTPNTYRTASGAPGEAYWQQQADHVITATLDEDAKRITASGDGHLQEQLAAFADLRLVPARPEPVQPGFGDTPDGDGCAGDAERRRSSELTDAAPAAVLRRQTPHGYEIQSVTDGQGSEAELHHQRHDDARGPAAAAGAGQDAGVPDHLGVQHRRQQPVRRTSGL